MKKLQLEKVRWKNFLSYGEPWSEMEFTRNRMTLLTGLNGNGKCINKNSVVTVNAHNKHVMQEFTEYVTQKKQNEKRKD